jgi:ankyrin repeat protein
MLLIFIYCLIFCSCHLRDTIILIILSRAGLTALMLACEKGHQEIVTELTKSGAIVNQVSAEGNIPTTTDKDTR